MRTLLVAVVATGLLLALSAPAAAQTACDPTQTAPQFRGQVPPLSDVVPAPGGENGEVTVDQAYAYMDAVDRASERVTTGALEKRTWQGRKLRFAIVGHGDRLRGGSLKAIAKAAQALRDPRTPPGAAKAIARRFPAILWVASNVHGGEESGTEGSLRVLYELADRDDCAARRILDNAIVVLLPIQNPDGREADTRRNFYGFDMNRDWFARTQPETDAKLELLRDYPSPLFIDAHEFAGANDYFFPPNADPIYHEIPDESIDWINNWYGAAHGGRVRPPRDPVLQPRRLRPLLHGLRRHRPGDGLPRRGHDLREGDQRPDRAARLRAVPDAVGDAVAGGGPQAADAGAVGRRRGARPTARGSTASSSRTRWSTPGNEVVDPGARPPGAPLLHHRAARLQAG